MMASYIPTLKALIKSKVEKVFQFSTTEVNYIIARLNETNNNLEYRLIDNDKPRWKRFDLTNNLSKHSSQTSAGGGSEASKYKRSFLIRNLYIIFPL